MKSPELAQLNGAFVLRPTDRPATKADYTVVAEQAGEIFKPSEFTVLTRLPTGDEPPAGISMIWPALRAGLKGMGRSYWRDPRDGEPAVDNWQERSLLDFKAHKAQIKRDREREPTYGVKEIDVDVLTDGARAWKRRLHAQSDHLKMHLTDGRVIFLARATCGAAARWRLPYAGSHVMWPVRPHTGRRATSGTSGSATSWSLPRSCSIPSTDLASTSGCNRSR